MATVELKSISELFGLQFFIPSYQRGYRWTTVQVRELLEDLYDFLMITSVKMMITIVFNQLLSRAVGNSGNWLMDNKDSLPFGFCLHFIIAAIVTMKLIWNTKSMNWSTKGSQYSQNYFH